MKIKIYLAALSAAFTFVIAAFFYGQSTGKAKMLVKWQANQLEVAKLYEAEVMKTAKEAQAIRAQLMEVEQAWLSESRKVKVEYRDRVREVIKVVEADNSLDACRLDGERLHHVQQAIMHANGN